VPANQRLRPYDFQRLKHAGSQAVEPDKHKAVNVAEGGPLRRSAPQDVELMTEYQDFGLQSNPRPEQFDQAAPDQPAKIAHRANYQPIRRPQSAVLGLR
jgi:hypothetical protein